MYGHSFRRGGWGHCFHGSVRVFVSILGAQSRFSTHTQEGCKLLRDTIPQISEERGRQRANCMVFLVKISVLDVAMMQMFYSNGSPSGG